MIQNETLFNPYTTTQKMLNYKNVTNYTYDMLNNFILTLEAEINQTKDNTWKHSIHLNDLLNTNKELNNLNKFLQESIGIINLQLTSTIKQYEQEVIRRNNFKKILSIWSSQKNFHTLLKKYQNGSNTYNWQNSNNLNMQFSEILSCCIYQYSRNILKYNKVSNKKYSFDQYIEFCKNYFKNTVKE